MDLNMSLSLKEQIKKVHWNEFLRVTILALVVGVVAGVIGSVVTENYLFRYNEQLKEIGIPLRLTEEKPRALPGTYEEAVEKIRSQVEPALAQVYLAASPYASLSDQIYDQDKALAAGVAVTSDGWLIMAGGVFDLYYQDALVIVIGRVVYEIEQVVVDQLTDLALVKISANNLPVITFGPSEDQQEGDLTFVIPAQDTLVSTSIKQISSQNSVVHNAEDLLERFILSDVIEINALGAPVTNSAGELIGFITLLDPASSTMPTGVRPLHHVLPAVDSILQTGEVIRSYLGVSVLDLALAVGLDEEETRGLEHGALVIRNPLSRYVSGVTPLSPADQAGLLESDIILSVNGESVGSYRSLSELLLNYEPGDQIDLQVDREGEQFDLAVTLDSL